MKVRSTGKLNRGNSTLEILIAFAVLTLCMTAVIMIGFGNQSVSVDTQTNNEALSQAEKILEDARANAHTNFLGVISYATTSTSTIAFNQKLDILDISECKKQATSTVSWSFDSRVQTISLTTFLSSTSTVADLGGDCATELPAPGWDNPREMGGINFGKAKGIDVVDKIAYITLSDNPNSQPDLAIVNVISSTSPFIISLTNIQNNPGYEAIDVASSSSGLFAYITNNDDANQLQVVNVSSSTNPILVASSTLPGITSGTHAIARSIFYYDKKVYIGTQYLPCPSCSAEQNNELQIYAVSNPSNPVWLDSIKVNRNVNSIIVRNGYAYLATGPGSAGVHNPFKIFDVNPSSPKYKQQIGSFTATGNEEGKSLYIIGNKAYLGLERATSNRPDFFVLDITRPDAVFSTDSTNLHLNPNTSVSGIRVSGSLAFLGITDPNDGFQVINVSNSNLPRISTYNFQQNTTGIDMDDNTVYLSADSGSRNLEIVGPTP